MSVNVGDTVQLGDLVVAVFDEAALYSKDPRVVSQFGAPVLECLTPHEKGARTWTQETRTFISSSRRSAGWT